MSSQPTTLQLAEAVLDSVRSGQYPDSEEVISAEITPPVFSVALELLSKARNDVKGNIRQYGRNTLPEVDRWIEEAKQLQLDIQLSEAESQKLVQLAAHGKNVRERLDDATNKRRLLKNEVAFNETLVESLEDINHVKDRLDEAQDKLRQGQVLPAVDTLGDLEQSLGSLAQLHATMTMKLVASRIADLRQDAIEKVDNCWNGFVVVNSEEQKITVRKEAPHDLPIDFDITIIALEKLDLLKSNLEKLVQDISTAILDTLFDSHSKNEAARVTTQGDSMQLSRSDDPTDARRLLENVNAIIDYLHTRLPPKVQTPFSQAFVPSLASKLISPWLTSYVPSGLEGMVEFQAVVAQVTSLRDTIVSYDWRGTDDLTDWIDNIPQVWLSKRKEVSLDSVRRAFSQKLDQTRQVERVETQKVAPNNAGILEPEGKDEWNKDWSDDEKDKAGPSAISAPAHDEEDVSAWGVDQDTIDQPEGHTQERQDSVGGWGWTEDNSPIEPVQSSQLNDSTVNHEGDRRLLQGPNAEREMTLTETYTITAIPQALLDIIVEIVDDAETLVTPGSNSEYDSVRPAATGLFTLPILILAMYRAASVLHYTRHPSGNMFLYNDSMWLADQLRALQQGESPNFVKRRIKPSGQLKLGSDITALEFFGKRAYKKEMERQRNTIIEILNRAHGFGNCTVEPYASECEHAVTATVDKIREVNENWKGVLSHSALLQSLGSQMSSVTHKLIIDIEDMGDISEAESQRLAQLCNRISSLNDLFLPGKENDQQSSDQQDAIPLTAIYTPNWLKFQFLATILESSLADIKYLWTEGELKLEFSAEEVIELIEALFTDSEHRRRTINDIKRNSVASG